MSMKITRPTQQDMRIGELPAKYLAMLRRIISAPSEIENDVYHYTVGTRYELVQPYSDLFDAMRNRRVINNDFNAGLYTEAGIYIGDKSPDDQFEDQNFTIRLTKQQLEGMKKFCKLSDIEERRESYQASVALRKEEMTRQKT